MATAMSAVPEVPPVGPEEPNPTNTAPPPELVNVALGYKPWRWHKRYIDHATLLAEQEADRRFSSITPYLENTHCTESGQMRKVIRSSAVRTNSTDAWIGIVLSRLTLAFVMLLIFAGPIASILALVLGPPMGAGYRTLAVIIAVVVTIPLTACLLTMIDKDKSDAWLYTVLVAATVLLIAATSGSSMWASGPAWLRIPFFHIAAKSSAWAVTATTVTLLLAIAADRIHDIRSAYLNRRRCPESYLINALTYVVHELPHTEDARATYLNELDAGARAIEEHWPMKIYGNSNGQSSELRSFAKQVGAAVRARHVSVGVGKIDPINLRGWLVLVLSALVTRDIEFFRLFDDEVRDTPSHITLWRRVGRPLLVAVLITVALAGLIFAFWHPGLPELLQRHGWRSLADDARVQAAILAGVFGLLKASVALYTPQTKGQVEGNPSGTASGIRRRRRKRTSQA